MTLYVRSSSFGLYSLILSCDGVGTCEDVKVDGDSVVVGNCRNIWKWMVIAWGWVIVGMWKWMVMVWGWEPVRVWR